MKQFIIQKENLMKQDEGILYLKRGEAVYIKNDRYRFCIKMEGIRESFKDVKYGTKLKLVIE